MKINLQFKKRCYLALIFEEIIDYKNVQAYGNFAPSFVNIAFKQPSQSVRSEKDFSQPFSDELKCTKQSDSRRVITWRKNGAYIHPSYITKPDIIGEKGILVCGCIMLSSRTPLYVFDASTVNSQCFRKNILDDYVRFLWCGYSPYGLILEVSGSQFFLNMLVMVLGRVISQHSSPPRLLEKCAPNSQFSGCNGVSTYTCGLASLQMRQFLFVDVAIQPEVRFIAKQNLLMKIGNNGNRFGPIRRIYALLDDRFDEIAKPN
ncbi:hypothetical protein TNCV_2054001 [Trichonephila clavipes]|nr:hypothetical protein TNCV_2054001 [Trichonephila clavipes]